MKFSKAWVAAAAVGIAICFFSPPTVFGKLSVKPKLTTGWQVESNFWKSEDDEQEVFTYLIQPGVELGYEGGRSLASLDYTLNALFYDDQEEVPPGQLKASEGDYVGHTALLKGDYRPSARLLLGLDNSFWLTRNSAQTDSLGNFTDRDKYSLNQFLTRAYYHLGRRLTVGVRYRNEQLRWLEGINEDSNENRVFGDLIYNISPTAHLDLEGQRWQREFEENTSDYTSNQLRLILRKQFKFVSFEAAGGYQDRQFDDPDEDDISTPAFLAGIAGQWPPAPDEPRTQFALRFDQNFNDNGLGAGYYVARRVSLVAGRVFFKKIETSITGWYQNSDYETNVGETSSGTLEKREDDLYYILGRIGYRIADWLTVYAGGGYEERKSNLKGFSFDNTFLRARIDCGFEF